MGAVDEEQVNRACERREVEAGAVAEEQLYPAGLRRPVEQVRRGTRRTRDMGVIQEGGA
jgi:hypothetical protein